jgi:hypothetical protein
MAGNNPTIHSLLMKGEWSLGKVLDICTQEELDLIISEYWTPYWKYPTIVPAEAHEIMIDDDYDDESIVQVIISPDADTNDSDDLPALVDGDNDDTEETAMDCLRGGDVGKDEDDLFLANDTTNKRKAVQVLTHSDYDEFERYQRRVCIERS